MSKDLKPQSPIAIRFQHDLKINGKGIRTQQSYVRMLRKFTEFLGDEPDAACEEDLRRYFLHISENQLWKPSTVNVAYQALKQFFRLTVSMRPVQAKRSLICPDCGGELICLGVVDGAAVPHSAFDSS